MIDIRSILIQMGIQFQDKGTYLKASCPNPAHEDKHPSWRIKTSPPYFHHCFSCGFGGNIYSLKRKLGMSQISLPPMSDSLFYGTTRRDQDKPVDSKMSISGYPVDPFEKEESILYCRRKSISNKFADRYGVKYSPLTRINETVFSRRLCIPIFEDNKMINIEGRSVIGSTPKVLYPKRSRRNTLFDIDNLDRSKTLYVTEGITHLPKLFELGYRNITSTLGAIITPRQLGLLSEFKDIVIIPDKDEAGEKLVAQIDKGYPHEFRVVLLPPDKPEGSDVADCSFEEIEHIMRNNIMDGAHYFQQKHGLIYSPSAISWL